MKKLKFKKLFIILAGIIAIGCILTFAYCKSISIKPNIILIVIDALRPDHLSCYGYQRHTSPNIDRLAEEGIIFTQAIAAAGWTTESVPSILTGTYSFIHGITNVNLPRNPSIKTLPQLLDSKGVNSALFTNHYPMNMVDIKDGFDLIYIVGDIRADSCHRLTLKVVNWIKKNKDSPFFIYLHYKGAHVLYRPPEPYKSMYLHDKFRGEPEFVPISDFKSGEKKYFGGGVIPYAVAENNITDPNYYISQYDGAISYTDAQIGYLIDSLKELGLDKNTLIILTADHGEMLGEHNKYFDHRGCYEENIRVPLIVRFPKLSLKGKTISQQVSLLDIVPTSLEIMEIDILRYIHGKSLLTLFKKNKSILHPYVYTTHSGAGAVAIRSEDWKLIRKSDTSYELYNLLNDPQEQHNLINKEKGKFEELKMVLEAYKKEATSFKEKKIKPLTDEQKEILKSLGYLQ